jgi:hypothetical protein
MAERKTSPAPGPVFTKRIAYMREAAEAMGLNTWRMSDETLARHLSRPGGKCAALIADARKRDGFPEAGGR